MKKLFFTLLFIPGLVWSAQQEVLTLDEASSQIEAPQSGDTYIMPRDTTIGSGTKHDGYVILDVAEIQTTDATQTTVDTLTLLDENTYHVEAFVIGVQSDGTDRASYHISGTFYRTSAGVATLQGASPTNIHAEESNASLDATFTVSGNDVRVSVTGIAAETWEWGTTLTYINMSN